MATTRDLIQELLKGELDAEERKLGEHILSYGIDEEVRSTLIKSFDPLFKTINDHLDSIHDVISRFAVTSLLSDLTFVAGLGSLGDVDHIVAGGNPQLRDEIIKRFSSES